MSKTFTFMEIKLKKTVFKMIENCIVKLVIMCLYIIYKH